MFHGADASRFEKPLEVVTSFFMAQLSAVVTTIKVQSIESAGVAVHLQHLSPLSVVRPKDAIQQPR